MTNSIRTTREDAGREGRQDAMECRPGCGACCIAISISSPIPGMPAGKPEGQRCVQLSDGNLCRLFGQADRPTVCVRFRASKETCGTSAEEAFALLVELERLTRPDAPLPASETRAFDPPKEV